MRHACPWSIGWALIVAASAFWSAPADADMPAQPDLKPLLEAIAPFRLVRAEALLDRDCYEAVAIAAMPRGRGAAIKCLIGDGAPRCAAFGPGDEDGMRFVRTGAPNVEAPHPAQSLCTADTKPTVPAPDWLAPVVDAVRADIRVIPFSDGSGLLLESWSRAATRHRLALRAGDAWRSTDLPNPDIFERASGPIHSIDAKPLLGRPGRAVIVGWYTGGSGMGTLFTELTLIAVDREGLRRIDDRPIGRLEWSASPEQRLEGPVEANWDYRARPHTEVRLAPSIGRGVLRLKPTLAAECQRRRGVTAGDERPSPDRETAGFERVCAAAGTWRLRDGAFVRAP